ncbi:hypothetical protein [Moraxella equi]|uniref:Uncharacterized protein n=1 Tax=Moraxella equi TaxID=60442 RepID=A0A378QRM7_9GAMM|nr:hypothetical protein [Moraxella equi]OPH38222.1 hypothetical protein B5J93_06660 [Moraxella equi]STZ03112.1 Uncharacterised protein [Moraxella equi]
MITIATPKALLDEAGSDINKCLSLIYMMMEYYDDENDSEITTRLAIIADMQESLGDKLRKCGAYLGEIDRKKPCTNRQKTDLERLPKVA